MKARWLSALFTLFLLLVVLWAIWEARGWPLKVKLTPWAVAIPTAIFMAAALLQDLFRRADRGETEHYLGQDLVTEVAQPLDPATERRRTANTLGWVLGFALAIWLLGFHVSVPLATFLYLRFVGREAWLLTVLVAVGTWASIALLFDCTMHIFFMKGALFSWVGVDPTGPFQTEVCRTVATILPK